MRPPPGLHPRRQRAPLLLLRALARDQGGRWDRGERCGGLLGGCIEGGPRDGHGPGPAPTRGHADVLKPHLVAPERGRALVLDCAPVAVEGARREGQPQRGPAAGALWA